MSFQDRIKAQVLDIRAKAADFLTDTCFILRKVSESTVHGVPTIVYAAPEEVSCRLIVRSGSSGGNIPAQERLVTQITYTGVYRLQLPYNTVLSEDDLIEYFDTVTGKTIQFDITYIPPHNVMMGAFIIGIEQKK